MGKFGIAAVLIAILVLGAVVAITWVLAGLWHKRRQR